MVRFKPVSEPYSLFLPNCWHSWCFRPIRRFCPINDRLSTLSLIIGGSGIFLISYFRHFCSFFVTFDHFLLPLSSLFYRSFSHFGHFSRFLTFRQFLTFWTGISAFLGGFTGVTGMIKTVKTAHFCSKQTEITTLTLTGRDTSGLSSEGILPKNGRGLCAEFPPS